MIQMVVARNECLSSEQRCFMIKVFDSTLRDGGYYTNWDFDQDVVDRYIWAMDRLPVDYIEVGYRQMPQSKYLGRFAFCPCYELERMREKTSKKIAVMLDEKNLNLLDVDVLIKPIQGMVDMIRIAVDPDYMDRALGVADAIKKLGLEVGINVMYLSKWYANPVFLSALKGSQSVVDVLFLVDSFGGAFPHMIRDAVLKIRDQISLPLGFHGHDNLQMALPNALAAIDEGVSYIDATILGMGRGAGNLKQELLLTVLNKNGLEVDFNVLGNSIESFMPLLEKYEWGTSLPYMISGINSFPQKEVMEWTCNRVYSLNCIVSALEKKKMVEVEGNRYPFFEGIRTQNVLIIGGGCSVATHINGIKAFLAKVKSVSIIFASARNVALFKDIHCSQYLCLMGKEGMRLHSVMGGGNFSGSCVLHPSPRSMGVEVPPFLSDKTFELKRVGFCSAYQDSCTALALQIALELTPDEVFIVGYDGYADRQGMKEQTLACENELLFEQFIAFYGKPPVSLVPSLYKGVKIDSVYQRVDRL